MPDGDSPPPLGPSRLAPPPAPTGCKTRQALPAPRHGPPVGPSQDCGAAAAIKYLGHAVQQVRKPAVASWSRPLQGGIRGVAEEGPGRRPAA